MTAHTRAVAWMVAAPLIAAAMCVLGFVRFGDGAGFALIAVAVLCGVAGGLGGWIAKRRRAP